MTTPLRPRTAELKEIIEFALSVGAISYDGDSWYAASGGGGAGLGYERCEASFAAARQALNELVAEAAPDLRAALERLLTAMEENPSPNGICDWSDAEHEAVAQARAALAAPAADGLDVPVFDHQPGPTIEYLTPEQHRGRAGHEPSREPGERP